MPSSGSNAKPATSEPSAAPAVFASVNSPAERVWPPSSFWSAAPSKVKTTPDNNELGNISNAPSQAIRQKSRR